MKISLILGPIYNYSAGGDFIKFSVVGFSRQTQIGPNQIYGFVKMRGQKDLKSLKKGVNWIEKLGKIYTKCLKSVKNAFW